MNIFRSLQTTSQGSTNLVRQFCRGYSSDMHSSRGGIWKGDILAADIEKPGNLAATCIHAPRLNAKEIITSKKGEKFTFPIADGTATLLGRDHESRESTLRQYEPVGSEDLCEELQRSSDDPQPTETDGGRWSSQRPLVDCTKTSFIVILLNLEFTSMCQEKNHSQYH